MTDWSLMLTSFIVFLLEKENGGKPPLPDRELSFCSAYAPHPVQPFIPLHAVAMVSSSLTSISIVLYLHPLLRTMIVKFKYFAYFLKYSKGFVFINITVAKW